MHKGLPIPDIIFLVDTAPKIAMQRMKDDENERAKKHKFEKDLEFMEKLRQNYLKLANLPNHNVVVIDGSKSAYHIFVEQIKPEFDRLIKDYHNNIYKPGGTQLEHGKRYR